MKPRYIPRSIGALVAALLLLGVLFPSVAWAHALLLRATPAENQLLRTAPTQIHLWFSEDLNPAASKIVVWDRYRHVENVGNATIVPGQPRQMVVRLKRLAPGSYLVLWTSVSAEDGHILHGYYLFSVKVRGPGPSLAGVSLSSGAQTFPNAAGLTSILAHWIELFSAVVWAGAVAFSLLIFGPLAGRLDRSAVQVERRRYRVTVQLSLVLLLLSSGVVILMLTYGLAGNSWSGVFSRSTWSGVFDDQYGKIWIAREALALLALAGSLYAWASAPAVSPSLAAASPITGRSLRSMWPTLALPLVYLYLFAASGHAAASAFGVVAGSHVLSVAVLVDWLHFIGDALWFGGQVYIVLVLLPTLRPAVADTRTLRSFLSLLNRFSPAAYISIALFTLSGVFSATIHIPSWYAFLNSVYGRTLMVKAVLIGAMMLVSVGTVYLIRPRIRRQLDEAGDVTDYARRLASGLTFWLRVNPVLGAGVLLATSVLFSYPVPAGFSPAGSGSYTVRGGGLTLNLTVKPGHSGPNTLDVTLLDAHRHLVPQANVTVLTTMLDMVMGTGVAPLKEKSPGHFTGTLDLPMGGHWRLTILVYQPSGNVVRSSVKIEVGT